MEEKEQIEILRDVGLTDGEIKVYLLLLRKGTFKTSQISKETNLNRSHLYKILDNLINKKLIFSSMIEKTKFFSVTRPERIKELYDQEFTYFKEKEVKINKLISGIKEFSILDDLKSPLSVEVYEGVHEVKQILSKVLSLKKGETVYAIGQKGKMSEYPKIKYWFDAFKVKRASKGINFYAVYDSFPGAESVNKKNTKIRYANLRGMEKIEISFYRDFLMIYVNTEEEPRVILIKSKEIVNSMISYFKFLWEKAKVA